MFCKDHNLIMYLRKILKFKDANEFKNAEDENFKFEFNSFINLLKAEKFLFIKFVKNKN